MAKPARLRATVLPPMAMSRHRCPSGRAQQYLRIQILDAYIVSDDDQCSYQQLYTPCSCKVAGDFYEPFWLHELLGIGSGDGGWRCCSRTVGRLGVRLILAVVGEQLLQRVLPRLVQLGLACGALALQHLLAPPGLQIQHLATHIGVGFAWLLRFAALHGVAVPNINVAAYVATAARNYGQTHAELRVLYSTTQSHIVSNHTT